MIFTEEGCVRSNEVLLSSSWVSAVDDATLVSAVRKLAAAAAHPLQQEIDCGGGASAAGVEIFHSAEEFFEAAKRWDARAATKGRKNELTKLRRREFEAVRADLELALMERDGYVCSQPGCKVVECLTIDHIVPISKGGKDHIANLRYLCRSHNSAKGDRPE